MNSNISIIIPTMNRPNSLKQTLNHIVQGKTIPSQLIVVDQSQEKSNREENLKAIQQHNTFFDNVTYLYQPIPSLTKARNLGYINATNEIIVFMDDDVDVNIDTFSNLIYLMSDKTISMAGGIQEGETDKYPSMLSYIFGISNFYKRNIGHVSRACFGNFPLHSKERTISEWAMGFFFAVRKSLLEKWHIRFDENLLSYAYAEDLDFTYNYFLKSRQDNQHCIISNKLVVKHNVSREYRIPKRKHIFMMVLHRYYISHKYKMPYFEINNLWCNFGMFIKKIIKREHPCDLLEAQLFYYKHRTDILKGKFIYEMWES